MILAQLGSLLPRGGFGALGQLPTYPTLIGNQALWCTVQYDTVKLTYSE